MSAIFGYGTCRECPTATDTPEVLLFPGERCAADHLMLAWESIDEVREDEYLTVVLDADLGLSFYEQDRGLIDRISSTHATWAPWVHTYFAVGAEACAAARSRILVEEQPDPLDLAEAS